MPASLRKHLEIINRAETDLALSRPGVTGQLRGVGGRGAGEWEEPRNAGLKALKVEATAGRRQALARLGERPTAEGRAGRGGRRARRTLAAAGPRLGAGCGRALGVRSGPEAGRAPGASPPRPASSPYHVAPPHVEEVSVHHGTVASAPLRHA